MYDPMDKILCIDIRSCAEVIQHGSIERIDAHIPYLGRSVDEWNVVRQRYHSYSNNVFLRCVLELTMENGLTRDCPIVLVTKSGARGAMAANILDVAGYSNVCVEVNGFYSDRGVHRKRENGQEVNYWRDARQLGSGYLLLTQRAGLLH
jgi:rhodanese-related sulfurtransferase